MWTFDVIELNGEISGATRWPCARNASRAAGASRPGLSAVVSQRKSLVKIGASFHMTRDPGVTVAQHILHLRCPNAKSLCTAVLTEPLKGPAATRADFDPDGAVMLS